MTAQLPQEGYVAFLAHPQLPTIALLEELIEDAAKKAAAIKKEPLPPANAKSNFVPWKNLLVSCGVITADEAELLQKLYNYISNAGTHRLGSAPEQARVAKNTVIELGLLVAGRVKGLA